MNSFEQQSSNPQDRAIDATLAALCQAAKPPSGLEQRVLQTLSERTATTQREHRRIAWFAIPVAVCAALAILLAPALRHTQHTSGLMAHNSPASFGLVPASHSQPAEKVLNRETPRRSPRPARMRRITIVRENSVSTTRRDTPPPPAPLTEQERLLLQIARSGDPGQRAMLNPEVLARKESEDDAQFRSFFAKSSNVQTRNP